MVGLGTTFVMMQTTMLDAATMVVTAVGMVSPLIVLNAFANKNKKLPYNLQTFQNLQKWALLRGGETLTPCKSVNT